MTCAQNENAPWQVVVRPKRLNAALRERAILRVLSEEGPVNKYRICKRLESNMGSEPTILYAVSELEKDGFIKVIETKDKVRGGKPSKLYDLSILGVTKLLAEQLKEKYDFEFVDHVAKKYRHLIPDLFAAWPAIVQAGLGDEIMPALADHIEWMADALVIRTEREAKGEVEKDEGGHLSYGHGIVPSPILVEPPSMCLDLTGFLDGVSYEKWLLDHPLIMILDVDHRRKKLVEAVRGNTILRQAVIKDLHELIERCRHRVTEVDKRVREAEIMINQLERMNQSPIEKNRKSRAHR